MSIDSITTLRRGLAALSLGLCAMAVSALAQTPAGAVKNGTAAPAPLIQEKVDNDQLVTLKGNVHPLATASADQGAAPDSLVLGRTFLVLKRSQTQQAALDKLTAAQQNPNSPSYHHWLTPQQYGAQFGVAPQDMAKITAWLRGIGFSVEAPLPGQNIVAFTGTNAQLKAAFHTELRSYKVNGKTYFANATDPQIPTALAPVVAGFASLNNFPLKPLHSEPRSMRHDATSGKWLPVAKPAANTQIAQTPHPSFTTTQKGQTYYPIVPYDLATIYNIKPLWDEGIDGTGETIAIVSDSDINPADVDYFRSTFGLPAKKLNILYDGPNPGLISGDEGEADLDVEWAGAVAKNATIDLVVAPTTNTSNGVIESAFYILSNNLAPIMNVSYGACELALGTSGNQLFTELWEQAAAQGITVVVASGDSGSGVCDQGYTYAEFGLSVSGFASTPYNVAVGGTDLYGTYAAPNTYWNSTNDPTTLASVKSYMPEAAWNDSCGNPDLLAALQAQGAQDATAEALCNDGNLQQYVLTLGSGSGGVSACTSSDGADPASCQGGNPKPTWQTGVPGIPNDKARDLPDVSLMAGDGLWSTFYVYCESDATSNGQCDVNNELEGAGGTSFASPIFAGMLALVEQKTNSKQGNANYMIYKLAAAQYSGSNANACTSSSVGGGNACTFYDVTDGNNQVPCLALSQNCTTSNGNDEFGLLSGYTTSAGYDLATGLGSINAYNMVQNWATSASSLVATTTTLTSHSTMIVYGASLDTTVMVSSSDSNGATPTGDIAILSDIPGNGNAAIGSATLGDGQVAAQVPALPVGTFHLFATYPGDASFAASKSTGLSVTVQPGTASGQVTATRTTLQSGQKTAIFVTLTGVENGVAPNGMVVIADIASNSTLATLPLTAAPGSPTTPSSTAYVTLASDQFKSGANTISVSYSGDGNYNPSTITAPTITLSANFAVALNLSTLTTAPSSTGSIVVTATPASGSTLDPASLTFACPTSLPTGITCAFSQPAAAQAGAVTSTLTLQTASTIVPIPSQPAVRSAYSSPWLPGKEADAKAATAASLSLAGIALLVLPRRRRRTFLTLGIVLFSTCTASLWMMGCGGSGNHITSPTQPTQPTQPTLTPTTTGLTASATQFALNSPVTLTAQVAANSGTGAPSGTVTFVNAAGLLGTATLSGGAARLTTSTLSVGAQNITAIYNGDTSFATSTSAGVGVDVTFTTALAISVSDNTGNTSSANLDLTIQ
jgi:hypothetical protein